MYSLIIVVSKLPGISLGRQQKMNCSLYQVQAEHPDVKTQVTLCIPATAVI
jgi:hypothetical protein